MKHVWPDAYLPKEQRTSCVEMTAISIMGALNFAFGVHQWSWPLAAVGGAIMLASGILGPRRYLAPRRKWYDEALWVVLGIAPVLKLYQLMHGPKDETMAGLIGTGVLVIWTIIVASVTWLLWRTGENGKATATSATSNPRPCRP